jgi:hypothetical protein
VLLLPASVYDHGPSLERWGPGGVWGRRCTWKTEGRRLLSPCPELATRPSHLQNPLSPSHRRGHFRIGLGREGTAAALEALEAFLRARFPSVRPADAA